MDRSSGACCWTLLPRWRLEPGDMPSSVALSAALKSSSLSVPSTSPVTGQVSGCGQIMCSHGHTFVKNPAERELESGGHFGAFLVLHLIKVCRVFSEIQSVVNIMWYAMEFFSPRNTMGRLRIVRRTGSA